MHISIMNLENLDEVKAEIEEGGSVAATDAAAAVATEFVEGPEEALAAADKAGDEIISLQDSAEQATVVGEKIEEMQEGLAKVVEQDGGLTPASAEVVQLGLEALREALRMPALTKVLPTFEQYGDKATQQEATLNLEAGFVDTLKTIWAAIVSAAIAIKNKLKDFFAALFDGAERARQRAEKLLSAAKGKAGAKAKADAKVKINGDVLNVDGTVLTGSAFVSAIKEHSKIQAVSNQTKIYSEIKKIADMLTSQIDKIGTEDFKAQSDKFDAETTKFAEESAKLSFKFGQQQLYVNSKASINLIQLIPQPNRKNVTQTEASALAASEIIEVAETLANHLKEYARLKESIKQIDATLDKVAQAAKSAASTASKAKDSKAVADAKLISRQAQGVFGYATVFSSQLRRYDLKVVGAALDYAGQSLKALEGGEGSANALPAPNGTKALEGG